MSYGYCYKCKRYCADEIDKYVDSNDEDDVIITKFKCRNKDCDVEYELYEKEM